MGDPEWVVETRALTKVYGRRRAVSELGLRIPRGSVFGLLGQNGAGKSTTLRMVLGLVKPTGGDVLLFGRPLARERMRLLPRVGCSIEGPCFYPYLSGRQNLKALGDLYGGVSWSQVDAVLERVGLGGRGGDPFEDYSTGMKQRLGLAGSIVHEPELVILDEPMSGLDPPAVVAVRRLISELAREEGKTVVLSSHILHEVELACDEVAMLHEGRLVASGSVRELLRPDVGRLEVRVDDVERAREVLGGLEGVTEVGVEEGVVRVEVEVGEGARLNRALWEAGVEVSALIPREVSLEERFHALSQGAVS